MTRRPETVPQSTDVLTTSEVAAWLKVSERTVERHFASFLPGRYLVSHVLAWIEELREERRAA
jgi:transcriptional regulator GlxA family with amidase domain